MLPVSVSSFVYHQIVVDTRRRHPALIGSARRAYIRLRVWKYSSYLWTKSFCASGMWQARHLPKSSISGLLLGS